jgi:hypothetical protein
MLFIRGLACKLSVSHTDMTSSELPQRPSGIDRLLSLGLTHNPQPHT